VVFHFGFNVILNLMLLKYKFSGSTLKYCSYNCMKWDGEESWGFVS